MRLTTAKRATCHPTRREVEDGLCRYCLTDRRAVMAFAAILRRPLSLPGVVRHVLPAVPPACPKCRNAALDEYEREVHCFTCGGIWLVVPT